MIGRRITPFHLPANAKAALFALVLRYFREQRGIGLRSFAHKLGVSPTYLSRIEHAEVLPPAEDKIIQIAKLLDIDADGMLAMAGKVAFDLTAIIQQHPRHYAAFLRQTSGMDEAELDSMLKKIGITVPAEPHSRQLSLPVEVKKQLRRQNKR